VLSHNCVVITATHQFAHPTEGNGAYPVSLERSETLTSADNFIVLSSLPLANVFIGLKATDQTSLSTQGLQALTCINIQLHSVSQ